MERYTTKSAVIRGEYRVSPATTENCIEAINKLGRYEDAEEKGLFVHLPCKVGDAVYGIEYNIDIGQIYIKEWQVESIKINEIGDIHMDLIDIMGERYYNESAYDFGTHYFLTREDAEQVLKARADK